MEDIFRGINKLKSENNLDKIDLSRLDWFMDELKIVKNGALVALKWCDFDRNAKPMF